MICQKLSLMIPFYPTPPQKPPLHLHSAPRLLHLIVLYLQVPADIGAGFCARGHQDGVSVGGSGQAFLPKLHLPANDYI